MHRSPDVNVWLTLLLADHIHRALASERWESGSSETIAFCRSAQISVLWLLTTAAAMNGKPLTTSEAWQAYDRLFEDGRVVLMPEPEAFEAEGIASIGISNSLQTGESYSFRIATGACRATSTR